MQAATLAQPQPTLLKRAALRALTGERLVTGLLLVTWGLFGLFTVMSHGALPTRGAEVPALLANAGFVFPFLKGLEILLKLYTAPGESPGVEASQRPTAPVVEAPRGRRDRRARRARAGRAGVAERTVPVAGQGLRAAGHLRAHAGTTAFAS